jgi:hypothetical protein
VEDKAFVIAWSSGDSVHLCLLDSTVLLLDHKFLCPR